MRAEEFVTEKKWSGKYKSSINCSHPKGFSQMAHCAGRKKSNESVAEAVCPDCGLCESHGSGDVQLQEACWAGYRKDGMKTMFGKRYPNCVKKKKKSESIDQQGVAEGARVARKAGQPADSKKHSDLYTDENPKGTITGLKFATAEDARASVGKIRSSGRSHAHKIQAAVAMEQRAKAAGKSEAAAVYRRYINANKKTESLEDQVEAITEDLRKWFKQKWVRFGPDGKIRGDCARGSAKEGKPKCLPQAKAHALGKKGRAKAGARKRRQDPDANRSGKAINVKTKSRSDK